MGAIKMATVLSTSSSQIQQLIGTIDGLEVAFPATNADGTSNQGAQTQAVVDAVKVAVSSGAFSVPPGTTADQIANFAQGLVLVVATYKAATKKPSLS